MNILHDLKIEEISILSKDVRPAVRAAQIAIVKHEEVSMRRYDKRAIPKQRDFYSDLDDYAVNHEGPKDFDAATRAIRARDKCSRTAAMSRARKEHPELLMKYQAEGVAGLVKRNADVAQSVSKAQAVIQFEKRIVEIAAREKCSRTEAMSTARQRHPNEFRAYQAA